MDEYIKSKIKEILLHKYHVEGKHGTPIPGLTLLCGQQGIKSHMESNILAVVLVIQGSEFVLYKDKHMIYHENDYYITAPQTWGTCHCMTACKAKSFLAFSLNISRHVLSLLYTEYSPMRFQHSEARDDAREESIKLDLFKCFQRLLLLMDKPEQIYIRAPIIICEIHSLILISGKWREVGQRFPTLDTGNRHGKFCLNIKAFQIPSSQNIA